MLAKKSHVRQRTKCLCEEQASDTDKSSWLQSNTKSALSHGSVYVLDLQAMVLAYGEQWDTNDQQDHCSQMLAISMGTVPMIGAKACLKVEQRSFETQSL